MAIKRLTVHSVANTDFRSLAEVETILTKIHARVDIKNRLIRQYSLAFARVNEVADTKEFEINRKGDGSPRKANPKFSADKIDKISIPKMDAVKKQYVLLQEIQEDLENVQVVWNKVQVKFNDKANQTIVNRVNTDITSLQKSIQMKYNDASAKLTAVGGQHEPDALKGLVQGVMDNLSKGMSYESYTNNVHVYEDDDGALRFLHYVSLEGLQNEDGSIFRQFYILFTAVLTAAAGEKMNAVYYANVLHAFEGPGKVELGRPVSDVKNATLVVSTMLELENVATNISTLPHNLDDKDLKKTAFSVGNLIDRIEPTSTAITFFFKKSVSGAACRAAGMALDKELKTKLPFKKAKVGIQFTKEEGQYVVRFNFLNSVGPGQISAQDIDFFRDLGVPDDKLKKMIRVWND